MTNETPVLPDKETYDELAKEAKSREEILALREMAQGDIAHTATASFNQGGDQDTTSTEVITSIGKEKLADVHEKTMNAYQPDEVVAPASQDWHTDEK